MSMNVADLDVAQLSEVRKQLEEELEHLTRSFAQLKQAQAKFTTCIENVNDLNNNNNNNDKTVLVPLTNSLYVPGRLTDPAHVVVDVGTGYYVKKTRAQAVKHYAAKVDYVRRNVQALEETIQQKREHASVVVGLMHQHQQQQQQQQQTT